MWACRPEFRTSSPRHSCVACSRELSRVSTTYGISTGNGLSSSKPIISFRLAAAVPMPWSISRLPADPAIYRKARRQWRTGPHRDRAALDRRIATLCPQSVLVVADTANLIGYLRVEGRLLKRLVGARPRPPVCNLLYLSFGCLLHHLLTERITLLAFDVL